MLRHSSIQITADIYADVLPGSTPPTVAAAPTLTLSQRQSTASTLVFSDPAIRRTATEYFLQLLGRTPNRNLNASGNPVDFRLDEMTNYFGNIGTTGNPEDNASARVGVFNVSIDTAAPIGDPNYHRVLTIVGEAEGPTSDFLEFMDPAHPAFCVIERTRLFKLRGPYEQEYPGHKLQVVDDSHLDYHLIANFVVPGIEPKELSDKGPSDE